MIVASAKYTDLTLIVDVVTGVDDPKTPESLVGVLTSKLLPEMYSSIMVSC